MVGPSATIIYIIIICVCSLIRSSIHFFIHLFIYLFICIPLIGIYWFVLKRNSTEGKIKVGIPKHLIGLVIGTHFYNIKQIEEKTGAKIDAINRELYVSGNDTQCKKAIRELKSSAVSNIYTSWVCGLPLFHSTYTYKVEIYYTFIHLYKYLLRCKISIFYTRNQSPQYLLVMKSTSGIQYSRPLFSLTTFFEMGIYLYYKCIKMQCSC